MNNALATARSADALMDLMLGLDERFRASARQVPELEQQDTRWHGLAFNVAGVRLVSAMADLAEMLPFPGMITRVPGARDWIVGLANVRGNLLPVTDLQAFLGGKPHVPGKASRVLVLRHEDLAAGVLVPAVQGMQQFDFEGHLPHARMDGPAGRYVFEAFEAAGETWPVFSMRALADDPRFLAAGA
jgi:twitching motility protein PilI